MLAIKATLRTALLWALIPLTVFAARPMAGCRCANGDYKLFCLSSYLGNSCEHSTSERFPNGTRACCKSNKSVKSAANHCCQNKNTQTTDPGNHFQSSSKSCCSFESLAQLAVTKQVDLPDGNAQFQFIALFPIDAKLQQVGATSICLLLANDPGPPGGDLLISLRRFLI